MFEAVVSPKIWMSSGYSQYDPADSSTIGLPRTCWPAAAAANVWNGIGVRMLVVPTL